MTSPTNRYLPFAIMKTTEQIAQLDAVVKSGDKAKTEAVFKEIGFCAECHNSFRAKE